MLNNFKIISISLTILISFFLIGISCGSLYGQIVARVGNSEITADQLSQEIEFISQEIEHEKLSYLERRDVALEKLIYEQLLYLYAQESRIGLTEQELESYFIAHFGDLPRFRTNGLFDMRKFQDLKSTPEVRRIMNELQRELIITKTETILKNNFRYNDHILLDRYIQENTDIDISYVVINEEDVNLPFFIDPFDAYDFYKRNKLSYPIPDFYNVEFFIVLFDRYRQGVSVSQYEINQYFSEIEYVPDALRDEIESIVREEKTKTLALDETIRLRNNLINGLPTDINVLDIRIYSSSFKFLNCESIFTRNNLISEIERIEINHYSQPIETDYGYLVFRVTAKDSSDNQLRYPIARNVWQDFVQKSVSQEYQEQYREHYRANLNDYIVPAAHITRFRINQDEMRERIRTNDRILRSFYENNLDLFSPEQRALGFREIREDIGEKYFQSQLLSLKDWCEENIYLAGYDMLPNESKNLTNGVQITNEVIFLELIPNKDEISDLVKNYLRKYLNTEVGSFQNKQDVVYYRINSYFPAYIPSFEDIENYLIRQLGIDTGENTVNYQEYYIEHLNFFTAPDSLKLTGVFVPISTDTLSVTETEVREFYLSHADRFYSEQVVVIEYIFLQDPDAQHKDLIDKISGWLSKQVPISLIQLSFGTDLGYPQNKPIPMRDLSASIYEIIRKLQVGQREGPVYFDDGWLIIRKVRDIPSRIKSYDEIRFDLYDELLHTRADSIAYESARQYFLEINRVSDLTNLKDSLLLFETDKKGINDLFPPLGDISAYAQRIINLRSNEKLNTLFRNDNGYGVIFLLSKDINQQYSFEESLPMISRMISADQRTTNAQNYMTQLREMIIAGTDPDSLLVFFGGWKKETNLTLSSIIPLIRYSNLIIDDANKREVGEISHVIRIGDDKYAFYQVDRKRRVGRDSFQFVRDDYREYVAEVEFRKWLNQYRERQIVEKF